MKTRQALSAVVFVNCVFFNVCIAQEQVSGCRELSQQIFYSTPPRSVRHARIVEVVAKAGGSVLVTSSLEAFYGTSNLGKKWTLLNGDQWTPLLQYSNSRAAPSDPNIRYKQEQVGIERSQDGGTTWSEPRPTVDGKTAEETALRLGGEHDYVFEVTITAVHPFKPLTLYATVMVSPPPRQGGDDREQFALRGMYISDDGGETWKRFSDQVGIFDKYPHWAVLGISPANPNIMLSDGERGILRSTDGGKVWKPVGQSDLLNQEALDAEDRASGLEPRRGAILAVKEFVLDPVSADVIYMRSAKGIHRSTDGGDTWMLLNLGFDRLNAVNSFAIDPLQPDRVFAGTDRGLFVSEDRGCHFVKMRRPESKPAIKSRTTAALVSEKPLANPPLQKP